jgi:hypothetical protein
MVHKIPYRKIGLQILQLRHTLNPTVKLLADSMNFDVIDSMTLVVIFILVLVYRFFQDSRKPSEERDSIAVTWLTIVTFGIPLAIAFVVLHFIIKYW